MALQEAASSDIPAPKELPPDDPLIEAKAEEASAPAPPLTLLSPRPVTPNSPTVLIGIAGASGSGKSALAQLLALVLPPGTPTFMINLNDYFLPTHYLVQNAAGHFDRDCRDAIDFSALARVLKYAKRRGELPHERYVHHGVDDEQQAHAVSFIAPEIVEELRQVLAKSGALQKGQAVGIVYGFLLYSESEIRDLLDIKLFLRVRKEEARATRFAKPEYVLEAEEEEWYGDFWTFERYFDGIAWPNYVNEHKALFENGDVEGVPLWGLCERLGLDMQPQMDMHVEQMLRWAVACIPKALEGRKKESTRDLAHDREIDPEVSFSRKYEACDCDHGWLGRVRKVLYDFV